MIVKLVKLNIEQRIKQHFRRQREMKNQVSKELAHVYFYRGKKFFTKKDAELYKTQLERKAQLLEEDLRNIDDQ
jgi:hypothetical protein